jgi:serine protease Do
LALLLYSLSVAQAQTLPRETRERIIRSTVMILPTGDDGKLTGSLGSGTLISPLGYILTNYHVVGDIEERKVSEWLQIRVIRFVDKEPEFRYWGQVVASDPNLDLAIVKIVEDQDEKPVGKLNLPFVELGDSNGLIIGDPIFVFGFQGTGGMTLSFSKGSVGGFTGEDRESSGKQWVKHDAQTGPGNSGGGVFDENGALIGVHSVGVAGNNNSRTAFMRPLSLALGMITLKVKGFAVYESEASQVEPEAQAPENWPPQLAVGQTWTINIKGHSDWTLKLDGKDNQGDPRGKAVSSKKENLDAFFYYLSEEDTVWLDMTADSSAYLVCQFEAQDYNGSTLSGTGLYRKNKNEQYKEVGACTARLTALATPTPNPTSLKWPVKPVVGQTWTFIIQNGGVWTVKLTEPDKQGDPRGEATSAKGETWAVFFYYKANEDVVWMDMTPDGKVYTSCKFDPQNISGKNLSGTAFYYKDNNASGDKLGTCTASLR